MSSCSSSSICESKALAFVKSEFKDSVLPSLSKFVAIPNQSPGFDPTGAHVEDAVKLLVNWVKEQKVPGLEISVHEEKGRTPCIFIEIEGENKTSETVFMYGHMDKQPPMAEAWANGLGPWKPVIKDNKLYGRGAADDGYSIYTAVTAVKAAKAQGHQHARIVMVMEACEESGSRDLDFYMKKLEKQIGTPSLVVCLDSGCGDYDHLWLTTSLRGLVIGILKVQIQREATHSGTSSGVVPSTFRIVRQLLDRIEDSKTGKILVPECHIEIPQKHIVYAREAGQTLGDGVYNSFPFLEGAQPMSKNVDELILNRTWRPTLSVTGGEGLPAPAAAGNVLRPMTSLKLSIRIPAGVNPDIAFAAVKKELERDPPYGAKVTFSPDHHGWGWAAPLLPEWLETEVNCASKAYWNGQTARFMGEGGSIPFMNMLGTKYPKCQFVVVGVLGPNSNAHGPNEFLDIPYAEKLTAAVAGILVAHHKNTKKATA